MESDYSVVSATVYDDWVNFLGNNEGEFPFSQKLPITTTTTTINDNNNNNYDISPIMNSSITTTPSLTAFDAPNDFFDSPLAGSTSSVSFNTSPNLEPTLGFFPDLDITIANTPSVIIPLDDEVISTTVANNHLSSVVNPKLPSSPALNIPWVSETAETAEDFVPDFNNNSSSSTTTTIPSSSPTPSSSSSSSPSNNNNKGSRKRSSEEIEKDPEEIAAIKRAKNTDAARRSRLRKAMKMESLEKQVSDLKTENNELQTKIAVMESEKKALEEKNSDKDLRIKMLEQQLAEVHERLIGRS